MQILSITVLLLFTMAFSIHDANAVWKFENGKLTNDEIISKEPTKREQLTQIFSQYRGTYDDRFLNIIINYTTDNIGFLPDEYANDPFWWGTWTKIPSEKKGVGLLEAVRIERIDRENDIWITTEGIKYHRNYAGSFQRVTPVENIKTCPIEWQVMTRIHCDFANMKKHEEQKATTYLKSNHIQIFTPSFAEIDNIFAYEYPISKWFDCDGNIVSQKTLECDIMRSMQDQEQKAVRIWNATKITNFKPSDGR